MDICPCVQEAVWHRVCALLSTPTFAPLKQESRRRSSVMRRPSQRFAGGGVSAVVHAMRTLPRADGASLAVTDGRKELGGERRGSVLLAGGDASAGMGRTGSQRHVDEKKTKLLHFTKVRSCGRRHVPLLDSRLTARVC
jgi:hypothetical protein